MCDICNVPLNIAEAPRADQQRREIRALIARGLTKDEIKAELRRRYGPAILAAARGRAASASPSGSCRSRVVVALARRRSRCCCRAGGGGRRRRAATPGAAAPELSAADARRLDEDLARYDAW